ncbi:AFG2-interacting ribosome maturation factor [Candoia aspera]|uniref:AFG2-interacting ribosome maturation factor n=1 Tax=Candoia aspera TaxID=51853 RepID=UPI002FD829F6
MPRLPPASCGPAPRPGLSAPRRPPPSPFLPGCAFCKERAAARGASTSPSRLPDGTRSALLRGRRRARTSRGRSASRLPGPRAKAEAGGGGRGRRRGAGRESASVEGGRVSVPGGAPGPPPPPSRRAGPPGSEMAAEPAARLREGLRAGLRGLREQHRAWRGALAACSPLLRALGNLARQAEAARRVAFGETPLRAFARLPERLRLKQRAAMEALLAELRREKLPALREARDAVGARVAALLLLLGGPGPALAPRPPAPCPRWADLLAALLDAEALYHAVYLEAQLLLLSLRYQDLPGVQAAPQVWARITQHGRRGRLEDTLLKVVFFLEDTW